MPPGGTTFDGNTVPPWIRGDFRGGLETGWRDATVVAKRLGVVRSALQTHQDTPLKASRPLSFRLLPPFGKGDFQSFSCRPAAPRSMKTASPLGQGGTSGGF